MVIVLYSVRNGWSLFYVFENKIEMHEMRR
jgi:hypothetical protein